MRVSVTLLIYKYIFLTTVNNQGKHVSVMVDKNVPPNHRYFTRLSRKSMLSRHFWQIFKL